MFYHFNTLLETNKTFWLEWGFMECWMIQNRSVNIWWIDLTQAQTTKKIYLGSQGLER